MEDDRIYGKPDEFRDKITEGCDYVQRLSWTVWERMATLQDVVTDPKELRQISLRAQLSFSADCRKMILNRMESPPFSLLPGDRLENLKTFKATEEPPESPSAFRMWKALKRGHPINNILEGLKLYDNLGATSLAAEHPHSALAIMRKNHKEYGEVQLFLRAQVCGMNRLLPQQPPRSLARAEQTLRTLEAKKPKRCGAYQMHVKVVSAAKTHALEVGGTRDFIAQQDVVIAAAASWKDLSDEDVRLLASRGRARASEKKREIEDKAEKLEVKIYNLSTAERRSLARFGGFRSTAGCRWTMDAMERMQASWKDESFLTPARLEAHIKRILTRPTPDEVMEARLTEFPQPYFDFMPLEDHTFPWTRRVCKTKSAFYGVGFMVEGEDFETKFYSFGTASGKPFGAMFTPLEPIIRNYCGASSVTAASLEGDIFGEHLHGWTFDPLIHVPECAVTPTPGLRMFVWPSLLIGRDRRIYADIPPVPWEEWVVHLPPLAPPKPRAEVAPRPKAKAGDVVRPYELEFKKHPKRVGERRMPVEKPAPRSDSESSSSDEDIKPEEELPLTDAERAAYRDYMEDYRATYAEEFPDLEYFRLQPRGGTANLKGGRGIFDSARSEPLPGGLGERFLAHFGFKTSFSAMYSTYSGRRLADLLCEYWRAKVNYFCTLWMESGGGEFEFSQEMVDGFDEPPEFTAAYASPASPRAFVNRANWLRALRPSEWQPI